MAKELPYFKFEPNEWENGNIQMFSREEKGLFIDLCSMYWSRLGDLPLKLAMQKLCAGNATALNSLCDEKIIEVIDGNIFIKFLSEQLNEFDDMSKQNSKNAKEGWEKRRKQKELCAGNATALNSLCENDAIRGEEIKGEEKKEDSKVPTFDVFLNHALLLNPNVNRMALRNKYEVWLGNGWKKQYKGRLVEIKNWKNTLLNSISYLGEESKKPTNKISV